MAFPSSSGTKAETLESAWSGARSSATKVKQMAGALKSASLAGPVPAQQILDFLAQLATQYDRLTVCAAVPGIGAYAANQVAGFDSATEFNAVLAAIDGVRNWMIANFPASGGYILQRQFDVAGRTTDRTFSTASLAGLRTQLDTLLAAID